MAIDVQLYDPQSGLRARLGSEGQLNVVVHPHPPIDEAVAALPFRQYFTDDGGATGSNDMRVNGSTTNADFYVTAHNEHDVYIKTVSVLISDTGAVLNKFGALTALTNGIEFFHDTQDTGVTVIHEAIQNNLDFVRLGLGIPPVGGGTTAFRADVSGSGADSYLPIIDLKNTFGLQWGLRLRKGTNDKLIFRIKDNLSAGIDEFNIIAYGIKI